MGIPEPRGMCGEPMCLAITAENACDKFPELDVYPRPEPSKSDKDYAAWYQGYQKWGRVKCSCGNGYFCRRHGQWIPGCYVTSGEALPRERQGEGYCPATHYTDNPEGVEVSKKREAEKSKQPTGSSSKHRQGSSAASEHIKSKAKSGPKSTSKEKPEEEKRHKRDKAPEAESSSKGKTRERTSKTDRESTKGARSSKPRQNVIPSPHEAANPGYEPGQEMAGTDYYTQGAGYAIGQGEPADWTYQYGDPYSMSPNSSSVSWTSPTATGPPLQGSSYYSAYGNPCTVGSSRFPGVPDEPYGGAEGVAISMARMNLGAGSQQSASGSHVHEYPALQPRYTATGYEYPPNEASGSYGAQEGIYTTAEDAYQTYGDPAAYYQTQYEEQQADVAYEFAQQQAGEVPAKSGHRKQKSKTQSSKKEGKDRPRHRS